MSPSSIVSYLASVNHSAILITLWKLEELEILCTFHFSQHFWVHLSYQRGDEYEKNGWVTQMKVVCDLQWVNMHHEFIIFPLFPHFKYFLWEGIYIQEEELWINFTIRDTILTKKHPKAIAISCHETSATSVQGGSVTEHDNTLKNFPRT